MEENVRSMIVAAGGSGMLGLLEKAGGEKELTIRTLDTLIRAAIEDRVKPEKGWERTTELCRLVLRYAEEFQSGSVNRLLQWEDEKLVTAAAENCCDAVLETARSILSLACRNETGSAESCLDRYVNNPENGCYKATDTTILRMAGALFEAGTQMTEGTPPALAAAAAASMMMVEAGCGAVLDAAQQQFAALVMDMSEGKIGAQLSEGALEEARKAIGTIDALRHEIDSRRKLGSRMNVQKDLELLKQETMEKAWAEHKEKMEREYI